MAKSLGLFCLLSIFAGCGKIVCKFKSDSELSLRKACTESVDCAGLGCAELSGSCVFSLEKAKEQSNCEKQLKEEICIAVGAPIQVCQWE